MTHGEDMIRAVMDGSFSDWEGADRKTQARLLHYHIPRPVSIPAQSLDLLLPYPLDCFQPHLPLGGPGLRFCTPVLQSQGEHQGVCIQVGGRVTRLR